MGRTKVSVQAIPLMSNGMQWLHKDTDANLTLVQMWVYAHTDVRLGAVPVSVQPLHPN